MQFKNINNIDNIVNRKYWLKIDLFLYLNIIYAHTHYRIYIDLQITVPSCQAEY